MLSKVQDQYARDVARVHGEPVQRLDDEYRSFLAELGGAPPPEMMGLDASGEQQGQGGRAGAGWKGRVGGQGQGQGGKGRGRGKGQGGGEGTGIVRSVLFCVGAWGGGGACCRCSCHTVQSACFSATVVGLLTGSGPALPVGG
jgi:hypothetical protein